MVCAIGKWLPYITMNRVKNRTRDMLNRKDSLYCLAKGQTSHNWFVESMLARYFVIDSIEFRIRWVT